MPTPEEVKKALGLIRKRTATHDYFFSKLSSPDWIEPLEKAGVFLTPPDAKREATGISFPSWPEAEYLSRMAELLPARVLSIMLKTPPTDNVRVHDNFASAAAAMPGKLAARWANRESRWLAEQQHLFFLLPDSLAKLCQHLARDGEGKGSLRLFRSLFRITDRGKGLWDVKSLLEPWQYEKAIGETYPSILEATGLTGYKHLCNLLDEALDPSSQADEEKDLSWAMRAAIEPHEQNISHSSIRDILIDTVRDAGDFMVNLLGSGSVVVLEELKRRERVLFRRLWLHFLVQHGELFPVETQSAALEQSNFFDSRVFHEYARLLRSTFPRLANDLQDVVLSWINEGPKIEKDFDARQKAGWQVRWLSILQDALSPEWKSNYKRLVETVGQPEYPDLLSYSTSGWGLSSPKTDQDLQSMSAEEIATFLLSWQPTKEWNSPVPEGLGRALQRAVSQSPGKFEPSLRSFHGMEATYARAMVQGFEEAAKQGHKLHWAAILDFLSWVISVPRDSIKSVPSHMDSDPHWGWARRAVASLLSTSFEKNLVPPSSRETSWALVRELTADSDPTPSDEISSSMDPATYSINTTRGEAMHSVVRYALWTRKKLDSSRPKAPTSTFEAMPEVREVLEWHLRPENDPSPAIHAVYGQWLPWLILLDRGWVAGHLSSIFPEDPKSSQLRDAAWMTYLTFCHAYNDPFEVLQGEYSKAIDRLSTAPGAYGHMGDPDVHLGEHLVLLMGRGLIPIDEAGLGYRFLTKTSDSTAAHSLASIGRLLKDQEKEVPYEVVDRFRLMWELLLKSLSARPETLQAFGWWFASGCFDPKWSTKLLLDVFALARGVDADFAVAEQLTQTVHEEPFGSLLALRALITADKDGWHVLGWKDSARAILRETLSNTMTQDEARTIIHLLGARGYMEFRDLLTGTSPK